MSDAIRIDFPHGQQLAEALRALSTETRGAILAAALEQGAEPIQAAAADRASIHRGPRRHPEAVPLAESIHIAVGRVGDQSATVSVGSNLSIAHLVEFGHRDVTPSGRDIGEVPAYPFLRPAIDEHAEEAVTIIGDALGKGIEDAFGRRAPHEGV